MGVRFVDFCNWVMQQFIECVTFVNQNRTYRPPGRWKSHRQTGQSLPYGVRIAITQHFHVNCCISA